MQWILRLTLLLAWLAGGMAARAADLIPWAADLEQAQKAAEEQRKLILIHFYNDHCPPCDRVEAEVFSQPRVAEAIARNYVPVKVHAGAQPKVAEQFRVDRWPTDIICTPAWQEVMRTTSPQKPEAYLGMVDQIAMQTGVGTGRNWQTSMQAVG
ncbi:MAG: thioredoxin family protein, partial [Planctomycetaceae bacterium]|nr:thioredoxin family protein [Planctomycetaceae bacterium]